MEEEVRKLKELVDGSDNIVFFGGAGVSTESGEGSHCLSSGFLLY